MATRKSWTQGPLMAYFQVADSQAFLKKNYKRSDQIFFSLAWPSKMITKLSQDQEDLSRRLKNTTAYQYD